MKTKKFTLTTTQFILVSFLVTILIGSLLLSLPISSRSGKPVSYMDALFTATTSTCVTGLVTLPTVSTWSVFGQIVILFLIQIGGLGVVTIMSGVMLLLNKKMGLREIRIQGDSVLEKVCKPVKEMTPKIEELIEDMLDTMYESGGVGLAAPQVGILKRIVVIDVTGDEPYILINPRIVETDGEQTGQEGCLSVPGKAGQVTRPNYVKAEALDINMEPFVLEGTELLARAICHELDHLDGHLYVEKVEGDLTTVNYNEIEEID